MTSLLRELVPVPMAFSDSSTITSRPDSASARHGLPARELQPGQRAQLLRHERSCGQSTAMWTASRHARGRYLVTIDGDGQNDPADIPALVRQAQELEAGGEHFCIAGFRHKRKDTEWKKIQSKIANAVRRQILDDGVPDTGCGLKLIPRSTWALLPYFTALCF